MHRELLRSRHRFVGHRSDRARQMKSKLLFHRISSESAEKHQPTLKYVQGLRGLSLGSQYFKESMEVLIDLYECLSKQLQLMIINQKVAELSRADKYREKVKLLRTVPGVGLLTGMEVLVELQDVQRLRSILLSNVPYRGEYLQGVDNQHSR